MKLYRYLMSVAGIDELRFCVHWTFKYAPRSPLHQLGFFCLTYDITVFADAQIGSFVVCSEGSKPSDDLIDFDLFTTGASGSGTATVAPVYTARPTASVDGSATSPSVNGDKTLSDSMSPPSAISTLLMN